MVDHDRRSVWDEAVNGATSCIKPLTDKEALRVFLGLYSMHKFRSIGTDESSFAVYAAAMVLLNRFNQEILAKVMTSFDLTTSEQERPLHFSLKEFNERPRERIKSGLLHGHYRRLTLAHMMGFVLAKRYCDELVVLIESGERPEKFKGAKILLPEDHRVQMISATGLSDYVGVIERGDYSDETYRDLVRSFRPDVYFGTSDFSSDRKDEWMKRAELVGARLVYLPKVEGISTTFVEKES